MPKENNLSSTKALPKQKQCSELRYGKLMDKAVKEFFPLCHECQIVSGPSSPIPMQRNELPDGPWEHLAADLLGPSF